MAFFGKKTSIGKLDIDTSGVTSDSPEVTKRLNRIESNYERLDEILSNLEVKIQNDNRLEKKPTPEVQSDTNSSDPKKPR